VLASLGILALLWSGRAWAENYPLDNIDFVSVNHRTNIILHTGSIVPVQKVLVSDSKLILDIDQIEATDTIRTNFTGAGNISHVILQPLNEHKIRLIIRGSDLGRPSLAFYSANSGSYSATNLADPEPGEAAIPFKTAPESDINAESSSPDSLSGASANAALEIPSASRRDTASGTGTDSPPLNIEPFHNIESSPGEDIQASPPEDAGSLQKSASSRASAGRPLTDISPLPPSEAPAKSDGDHNNPLESLLSLPWSGYLPYALLGGLLLGLGLFVRNRLARITQADPQLEELLDTKRADAGQSGKRSSFREMADAYRSKREERSVPESGRLPMTSSRRTDAKDVIGLHSLEQSFPDVESGLDESLSPSPTGRASGRTSQTPHQAAAPAPAPAVSLEQLLAALQKAQSVQGGHAIKPSASPKSRPAVNPYAPPQAASPKKSRTPAASAPLPVVERPELQQKATAPVNQALAARKNAPASPSISPFVPPSVSSAAQTGGKSGPVSMPSAKGASVRPESARARQGDMQGPLPGNPEVLNFLRNVADLMEKDGKTDIAQNIHKKLNSQSLGLVR
jgi:hypothetical protein